ncbi:GTP pyrophosphokinase [Alloscardovia macacae]|uniref:GTP pyrophosphokinase n=1 Tax=Alloscardovia macacae TaxID=1160091 RepID=A0A1Y2T095_9BIFI|nr:GTP pyrophosphokinase [Alloscardovia macacae]OTA25529.1 GTP pyrophosphokinase [Alloscardovia macacae]OTA28097.1 GTP pyrophosphokinase [Alloscardovia macacae]
MVESIYGTRRPAMERVQARVVQELAAANAREKLYEHVITRIKSEDSMREKCARRGLKPTPESALSEIRDAIGIRVVTGFIEDIHRVVEVLRALPGVQIVEEKDYVYNAKPNGYRSYHAILAVRDPGAPDGHDEPNENASYYVEVQVRTIAMDSWAALEHQMKYKKGIANQDRIAAELKRCADELASCDMSMQTIRHLINGD